MTVVASRSVRMAEDCGRKSVFLLFPIEVG